MKKIILSVVFITISMLGYSTYHCKLVQPSKEIIKDQPEGLTQVFFFTSRNPDGGNGHMVILNDSLPVIQDFEQTDMQRPYGIAVDTAGLKVFISDYSLGIIYRFDIDGKNPVKILDISIPGQEIVDYPEALMVIGDKLYWGRTGGIYRCNMDGSSPEVFINTGTSAPEYPIDMQYDPISGKIYLVNDKTDYSGGYFNMNFDGSAITELIPDIDGTAIEVNFETGKTYMAIYASDGSPVTENGIYICNTDGTGLSKIGDYGVKATWGLTIDHMRNKLFWGYKTSNSSPDGKIIRANLDGSGQEDWITGISPHAMEIAWVRDLNVGIPENTHAGIQVYPNPAIDQLYINGDFKNARLILCTIDGRIVYTSEDKSQEARINVSDFERGFYFLQIKSHQGVITRKLVLIN